MLRVTAEGFLLTLFVGMPLALWLATWAITGADTEERRDALLHLYHAHIGTMLVDGAPIDAVVPDEGWELWWGAVAVFTLTPGAACFDPCPQSARPVM